MAWNICYNDKLKIIELAYLDDVSPQELEDAFNATLAMSGTRGGAGKSWRIVVR